MCGPALGALVASLLVAPSGAVAAVGSDFNAGPGAYTANTTTLKLTGPGTDVNGDLLSGVAVFSFDNVNVQNGATITVVGTRPFRLAASGSLTLAGVIDGNGASATDFTVGPNPGGPGGGAGGMDGSEPGSGPGGGGVASSANGGGGGGGFGGPGARGGTSTGVPGTAGAAYGDLNAAFQGGSGGAGGSTGGGSGTGGGGGGGAIALVGQTVTVTATGVMNADGGHGATGGLGASGGGSGGGIIVQGDTVRVDGKLTARGGLGGAGGCCGDGGGGGGGRILYRFNTLLASGTAVVAGGASGARSTGGFGHGALSPDPTGKPGVVTKVSTAPPVVPVQRVKFQVAKDKFVAVGGGRYRVENLRLTKISKGAKLRVTCKGRGCAFKSKKVKLQGKRKANLTKLFKGRPLGPRATIVIHATKKGWVGKAVIYKIRKGKLKKPTTRCSAPGSKKLVKCSKV